MGLRDEFDALDATAVRRLVEDGREEDVRLEFKTISRPDLSSRPDRKNLAIAVSGFANSSGGIIIWGVAARADAEGIDRAVGSGNHTPSTIRQQAFGVFGELFGTCRRRITHRAIATANDAGFAATYVPESTRAPQMAKLGEDRYYKRNASRFYVLDHFDLQDIFGRRQRPALTVSMELHLRPGDDPHEELEIRLINEGRSIAKHAGLNCALQEDVTVVGAKGSIQNVSRLNGGRPSFAYSNSVSVIHPNKIHCSIGHAIIRRENKGGPLAVEGTVFCEDMPSAAFADVH